MPTAKNQKKSRHELVDEFLAVCDSIEDAGGSLFATDVAMVQPSAEARAAAQQLAAGLTTNNEQCVRRVASKLDRLRELFGAEDEPATGRSCG